MNAYLLIRDQPWYRRDAFASGLRAAGHSVLVRRPAALDSSTLLVIWNRYGDLHALALQVERAGGKVIVAENGYLGAGGSVPKFDVHPSGPQSHHYYSVTLGYHNDDLSVVHGVGASRFARLGVELKPWREEGDYVMVCPNRAFGVPERMMAPDWAERCARRFASTTNRPVRIRKHPGNDAPKRPLSADLAGAWAMVVWSSSCGVHALAAGIPVFVEAPYWIMKGASAHGHVDHPHLIPREPAFERLAWAQWTLEEISQGEPFRHLLPDAQ